MTADEKSDLRGFWAFFGWLFAYYELTRSMDPSKGSLRSWYWALTKVLNNRSTYGNWAGPSFQS